MNKTLTYDLRAELEWCIADGNCGPRTRAMLVALRALLAAQQPEPRASTAIPRVHGVGRVADNPCAVLVMLKAEPSDETLRAIHDRLTAEPEPRAEVTENSYRELLAVLVDIYDDQRNNAPENRCYVEGAWSEVLGEARALLAPLPDPAQVVAESPDWIKNVLPPEGA